MDNDPRGILGRQVKAEMNKLRRAMEVSTGALVQVGAWRWEDMWTMWVWREILRSPSPLHLSVGVFKVDFVGHIRADFVFDFESDFVRP